MVRRAELAALIATLALLGCPPEPTTPTTPVVSTPAPTANESPPPLLPAGTLAQPLPRLPLEGPVYSSGPWGTRESALAPGDGRAALQAHCSTCHSTTYVTMQPPLTTAGWDATVTKMLKTYGAQVPDEAAKLVLAYLASHYTPETVEATYAALASSAASAADDPGARVYRSSCAPCHQADGKGLPGAFPPLVAHAPTLLPARRAHLVRLVLWGQQGPIEAAGQKFDGAMPGFAQLSDAELAAALNHVTHAWGNASKRPAGTAPFTPDEVAAARGEALAPREVFERR